MIKLQVLPEEPLRLQVFGELVKTGAPTILPKHITENGVYYAGADKASGYDPVTVEVDMLPAMEEGYNMAVADMEAKYFWLPYTTTAEYLFSQALFPEETELVFTVNPVVVNMTYFMRQAKNLRKVKLICNWQPAKPETATMRAHQAFAYLSAETIDLTQMPVLWGDCNLLFAYNSNLKQVLGTLDLSRATAIMNMFTGCDSLESVAFVPGTIGQSISFASCSKLKEQAVRSVLEGLSDLSGAASQTLTFHSSVGQLLTAEQKAELTAKNWTLVY